MSFDNDVKSRSNGSPRILKSDPNAIDENLQVAIERIDVAKAHEYLQYNDSNRQIKEGHLRALCREINHRFFGGVDLIAFDIYGKLLNGQHRLLAVISTGIPITVVVVRGVDPRAKRVFDTNEGRKSQDYFQMRGKSYTVVVSAAGRLLLSLKSIGNKRPSLARERILPQEVTEFVEKRHEGLFDSAPLINKAAREVGNPGNICAFHYLASKEHPRAVERAMRVMETGEPDYESDPIHRFTMRMYKVKRDRVIIHRDQQFFTLVKCFNMFLRHETLSQVKFATEPEVIKGVDYQKL